MIRIMLISLYRKWLLQTSFDGKIFLEDKDRISTSPELYGPAVILPEEPLSVDENIENLSFERNTYDECVEYICKDLEEAYSLLDPTRPSTQFERPTKYAAAALMSRVRLYRLFQVVQRQSILCRLDHLRQDET